jgi:hypothetical protein
MPVTVRQNGTIVMKAYVTLAAAAMLGLVVGTLAARADDCEDVINHVEDVVQVQSKILQNRMAQVTKASNEASDDKSKAAVKKTFCSGSGEFLGVSRAYRAVASECMRGTKRRETLASLDKSIKQLEDSMKPNCQ